MTREEVLSALRPLVADSLAVPPEKVQLTCSLVDDLGADSLDFVDIIFRAEKRFGIKLTDTEFEFLTRLDFSSPAVLRDGALTPETVERLTATLPGIGRLPDPSHVTPSQLYSLITVETLCILVEKKIPRASAAPSGVSTNS